MGHLGLLEAKVEEGNLGLGDGAGHRRRGNIAIERVALHERRIALRLANR